MRDAKIDRSIDYHPIISTIQTQTMNLRPFTLIPLIILIVTTIESATASIPQPDRNGNYFSNEAPLKGRVSSPLMAGSLWQVMSFRLNCRRNAGVRYEITRQFKQGDVLQADVGRGGADEVLFNAKDEKGQPWMRVRNSQGKPYNCYVRANRLYLQPYQP